MCKDVMRYLNLFEVSSLQILEKSKTPTTYEIELFLALTNDCTLLSHLRSIQTTKEVLDTYLR